MIALATIVGAVLAALACRVGHMLGASNENPVNALRVIGGTLLFAMAAGAAADGMALGTITALMCGLFVSIGGIDIIRREMRDEREQLAEEVDFVPAPRDGDTMEMPVIIRDVA